MSSEEALDEFYAALLDDDAEELYERAPCAYLSTTPDGTIIKVNRTFLTWTGYDRADVVGRRTFSELLPLGGRIYYETHYAPMLEMQGRAREIALEIVAADGRRIPALVNSVLERGEDGRPQVVRTVIFDATERREYERELLRAKELAEASERRATALARTLQQTLIPPQPPAVPGLDVAGAYRPAGKGDEVGGDFYDVFEVADGDWVVAIGDVRGKGVEAAVVTALARYTIRGAAVRLSRPSEILAALNDVLLRDGTDRFCTVALARLRQTGSGWSATVSCGGHPLPVVARPDALPATAGRPGSLLGVFADASWTDTDVELRSGDAMVLYTDGVTEGRAGTVFYGEDRLDAVVANGEGPASELADRVLADVLAFQGGDARDDIALVVIRVP